MKYKVSYKYIFSNRSGSKMSGSKSGSADMSGTGSGEGPEGAEGFQDSLINKTQPVTLRVVV